MYRLRSGVESKTRLCKDEDSMQEDIDIRASGLTALYKDGNVSPRYSI